MSLLMIEPREPHRRTHATVWYSDTAPDDPAPPFHSGGVEMTYMVGMLDPAGHRALVPEGLEPTDHGATIVVFYRVAAGYGLGAFNAFYAATAVSGHDSPDGSEALHILAGSFGGRAGTLLPRHYHRLYAAGSPGFDHEGGTVTAEADYEGCRFAVRGRVPTDPPTFVSGAHQWITEPPGMPRSTWATPGPSEPPLLRARRADGRDSRRPPARTAARLRAEIPLLLLRHVLDMGRAGPVER